MNASAWKPIANGPSVGTSLAWMSQTEDYDPLPDAVGTTGHKNSLSPKILKKCYSAEPR